ncbi:MAG: hypothetical protein VB078_08440 [Clostridiaceae bacterium]|nr:hypothetical protein [Clostridiaceae bacterium]
MKKILTFGLSMVIVAAIAITGTLAYLSDDTDSITNRFTFGNISMKLEETYAANSKIYPGAVIAKTPVITINAKSETCYVYALVDNGFASDMATLNISADWTAIGRTGTKTVYVYKTTVANSENDQALTAIFTQVTFSGENLTSANIETVAGSTITVDAFAYQSAERTQSDANTAALAHFGVTAL